MLVGSAGDLIVLHFRPTLDAPGAAQRPVLAEPLPDAPRATAASFLGVPDAGMYALLGTLERATRAREGTAGDETYQAALAERLAAERASVQVQRRLSPPAPTAAMPWVCCCAMRRRCVPGQNWHELSLEERGRLRWAHGTSGRRHAGRIVQVVTGPIGLHVWQWGVTLFGADPLAFETASAATARAVG